MKQHRQRVIRWLLIFVVCIPFLTFEIETSDRENISLSDLVISSALAGDLADINAAASEKAYKAGVKAYRLKKYRKALEHFQRALLLIERLEDENDRARRTANTHYNMGQALRSSKRYNEALQYYTKALQYYYSAQSSTNESKTYFNIGRCLNNLKRYADAADAYANCADIGRSCGVNPDMILEAQRREKKALAKASEQGHVGPYPNEPEYPDGDDGYYQDEPEPFGGNDGYYPEDHVPPGEPGQYYPEGSGPVDERYPEDRGPETGLDNYYPEDNMPPAEQGEHYPEDYIPPGEPGENYPEDNGPAGEYNDRYPDEQPAQGY